MINLKKNQLRTFLYVPTLENIFKSLQIFHTTTNYALPVMIMKKETPKWKAKSSLCAIHHLISHNNLNIFSFWSWPLIGSLSSTDMSNMAPPQSWNKKTPWFLNLYKRRNGIQIFEGRQKMLNTIFHKVDVENQINTNL